MGAQAAAGTQMHVVGKGGAAPSLGLQVMALPWQPLAHPMGVHPQSVQATAVKLENAFGSYSYPMFRPLAAASRAAQVH